MFASRASFERYNRKKFVRTAGRQRANLTAKVSFVLRPMYLKVAAATNERLGLCYNCGWKQRLPVTDPAIIRNKSLTQVRQTQSAFHPHATHLLQRRRPSISPLAGQPPFLIKVGAWSVRKTESLPLR